MKRVVLSVLLLILFIESSILKLTPQVAEDLNSGKADILIAMKQKVNLEKFYHTKMDHITKGRVIVSELMKTAHESQQEVIKILKQRNVWFKPYWISNVIAVEAAPLDLIFELASRDDVAEIRSDKAFKVELEKPDHVYPIGKEEHGIYQTPEWNIKQIKAPEAWAKGFTGKGFTVASADTGVEWTHEALRKNYRGLKEDGSVDHNYNWWDGVKKPVVAGKSNVCGYNVSYPCDDDGHGSHTVGTMLGSNAQRILGVAPQAKWIGCRNMDDGDGRPHTYLEVCFTPPTDLAGRNPNPDLRPHAIGNSYGCPRSEKCEPNTLKDASDALRAAGVFMSVAAGNSGSRCSTVNDPPGIYGSVISIGATGYNTENIAYFSSRGPVTVDGSQRRKPDLTAPGTSVYSSVRNNRYATYSGTSMATPHVAGAIAVVWQAKPDLVRDIDATQTWLEKTANPRSSNDCGSSGVPNNVYGYGMINLERATEQ